MGSKNYRTLFLKEFAKHLIMNSKSENGLFAYHSAIPVSSALPPILSIKHTEENSFPIQAPPVFQMMPPSVKSLEEINSPIQPVYPSFQIRVPDRIMPEIPQFQGNIPGNTPEVNSPIALITPAPQPMPVGFSIEKLNPLLADKTVTVIECAGAGKPILLRSMGRIVATRMVLSEEEIKKILENFSQFSKIPLIEGIFKAAVGSLVITAVLSNFVGSRFIINKNTPYSILDQSKNI